jgi:hypothetical protein
MFTSLSFAKTVKCEFGKNYKSLFDYNDKTGKITVLKDKQKIHQCNIVMTNSPVNPLEQKTAGDAVFEFDIVDCVSFNDQLKSEVEMGTKGFLKINGPKKSYLNFAKNNNTARCR